MHIIIKMQLPSVVLRISVHNTWIDSKMASPQNFEKHPKPIDFLTEQTIPFKLEEMNINFCH